MRTGKSYKNWQRALKTAILCFFVAFLKPSICSAQLIAPIILLGPISQTVSEGNSVSFSVSVVSLETPTYQWYFNGAPISDATGSSYSISKATAKNAGSYYVICVNGVGPTTSGTATLTVLITPPVANNDSYSVLENTLRTVAASGVLANDVDTYGGTMSAVLVSNVSHGTLNLSANGAFTYWRPPTTMEPIVSLTAPLTVPPIQTLQR